MVILGVALTIFLLSSTNLCQTTNDEATITIKGKKYVLIPEQTFGKLEKALDELEERRVEVKDKEAEIENANLIIVKDKEAIEALKSAVANLEAANASLQKSLDAQTRATDSEVSARLDVEKALAVSETAREEVEAKLKKSRRYGFISTAAAVVLGFLLFK